MYIKESVNVGGKELSIETGKMAKQADGSVVVRYGDTMVLVTAVANKTAARGRRLPAAHRRVHREDGGRRQDPGRLLQARRSPDRARDPDLPPHRPSVAPAVPEDVAQRDAGHRHGALVRQGEPVGRAGDDRRVGGAAHLGHSVGGAVRGGARRSRRRRRGPQVHRQPDLRRVARRRISTSSSLPRVTPSSWSRAARRSSPKTS